MEKQMQRGGKSIMAGDSKYSRVLSLLGLCHWCHVELAWLKLIWEFSEVRIKQNYLNKNVSCLRPFIKIWTNVCSSFLSSRWLKSYKTTVISTQISPVRVGKIIWIIIKQIFTFLNYCLTFLHHSLMTHSKKNELLSRWLSSTWLKMIPSIQRTAEKNNRWEGLS